MKQIITALLKAQKEMGNAVKGANNPFFKSKYADLNAVREAVMPLLNENGIVVLQPMVTIDGNEYVNTQLLHESGEIIQSYTKILCKSINDPQAYGSGVTYARRYGLQALLSIGADDDDGNAASKTKSMIDVDREMSRLRQKKTVEELGAAYKLLPETTQFAIKDLVAAYKNELIQQQKQ